MADHGDTAVRILDAAQLLVQTRGYNGFSYADVAARVGIRNATIHYHFPSKADLGRDLVARYRADFRRRLAVFDRENPEPRRRLERYLGLYEDALRGDGRMCLCGMLAADIATLPEAVGGEVRGFFADQEAWLTGVLAAGRQAGTFRFAAPADDEARHLLAGLEGAMLVARSFDDIGRFASVAQRLITVLDAT